MTQNSLTRLLTASRKLLSYWEVAKEYAYVDHRIKIITYKLRFAAQFQDDDNLILIGGQVGAGKSTLAHHIHFLYTEGEPNIDNIAFDREGFARIQSEAMSDEEIKHRVIHYDEANVSKRDAITKWNKDLIDLYEANRGDNGLHLWCNPSVEYLDKKFIEERVKGLFYIFKRPKGLYIYIPRKRLLQLKEKHGLSQDMIERYGKKFAIVRKGWFHAYKKDAFYLEYEERKLGRIADKREAFAEKWGGGTKTFSMKGAARVLNVSPSYLGKRIAEMVGAGYFSERDIRRDTGMYQITPAYLEEMRAFVKAKTSKNG